tara:strand:- start:531 stop:863 length:333 start_codon:yes stop_codon:yes gene_type:complete
MGYYEMYVCLKKATYESQIPTELQSNLGWNDDDGNAYRPTWKEAAFKGKLGQALTSPNGSYIIVKGQFSMKEGELSAIASLGTSMNYPNNTVLTQSEAQALIQSDTWNNG